MGCCSIHIKCHLQIPGSHPPTYCLLNFQEQLVELREMHCLGCLYIVKSVWKRFAGKVWQKSLCGPQECHPLVAGAPQEPCPFQEYENFISETLSIESLAIGDQVSLQSLSPSRGNCGQKFTSLIIALVCVVIRGAVQELSVIYQQQNLETSSTLGALVQREY